MSDKFQFENSSVGNGNGGAGAGSVSQAQSPVPQAKQSQGAAGLMAKEVLAVDTLKKKLEYDLQFTFFQFADFNVLVFQNSI